MATMTSRLALLALAATLGTTAAVAADLPEKSKSGDQAWRERSSICLVSTQHCLDIAQEPAKFCLLGAGECSRDGALVKAAPRLRKPALSSRAK